MIGQKRPGATRMKRLASRAWWCVLKGRAAAPEAWAARVRGISGHTAARLLRRTAHKHGIQLS